MKVRGLILVLLVPWLVHAQQQYYGTRVAGLTLSGAESQTDLQIVPLHAGEILTAEGVRASIQTLYDTGRYSYIEVDATAGAEGTTNLNFRVRPHFFFGTFRLVPEDLLERSPSGYFRLPIGQKFTTSAVDRIVQDMTELLKSQGYFEATVTPEYDFNESTRLVVVTLRAEPGTKAKVASAEIQGGEQTFSQKELQGALDLHPGDDFSATKLDKSQTDIRKKFTDLGFLNTRVNVDRQYSSATQSVDLKLTIQPGQFTLVQTQGYDISKKKLRELVPLYEEGSIDQDLVEEGRVEIDRFMKREGYFEAMVTSTTIEAPLDNAIQINYTIVPGVPHRIESVTIEGNKHFSADEIRKRSKVRKAELFDRGAFSPDLLDEDVQAIQAMYYNAGFEDTKVRGSYEETDHALDIVIRIDEGTRLPVEFVTFLGNQTVAEQELRQKVELKAGDTYTPKAVDQARVALTQLYYSKGYADVRVEPIVSRVETNHGMLVTFQITEGEAYKIGSILVAGNTLTKEKIIHRNSNLYPNTPYNPEAILDGQQKLYATGLFNRVDIVTLEQNLQGIRNLLIQVEDAKPVQLTYGVGYQDFEGVRGTIEVSHNNLFGLDRAASAWLRTSRREQRFQATYSEPRLFNRNLDGYASLFIEHVVRPVFEASRIDFSLQTVKRFTATDSFLIRAGYQTVNLQDIRVNPLAQRFPDERGTIQIAGIGPSFVQDRRNDPLNPTIGSFKTTTFQVASRAIGSEVDFTTLFSQSSFYSPVPHGTLATSVRFGWAQPFGPTKVVPITERYFAGGSTTLRGFGQDKARLLGGNVLTIGNVEYRVPFPIFPISGIGGALFYDTGNVFQRLSDVSLSDFSHSVGFGLRYQSPLGPIRLDFGFRLKPGPIVDGLEQKRFHVFFTLGNPF